MVCVGGAVSFYVGPSQCSPTFMRCCGLMMSNGLEVLTMP